MPRHAHALLPTLHPARGPRLLAVLLLAGAASQLGCQEKVFNVQVGETVSPDFTVRGIIGTRGGKLSVDDPDNPAFGTEVTVPPGAVSADTEMTISPASSSRGTPPGTRSLGPAVVITFPGIARPAEVRLPSPSTAAATRRGWSCGCP
jgi:hypothetical protein